MTPPRARVLAVALAVAAVVRVSAAARPETPPRPTRACTRAVMVDTVLRCDAEAPRHLADVCGGTGPATSDALAGGDALETALLCARATAHRGGPGWGRMEPADLATLAQPVDLNRAGAAELESLHGIGPALAQRIVAGRPYATVDAVIGVRGIGPKKLAAIRSRAVVGP